MPIPVVIKQPKVGQFLPHLISGTVHKITMVYCQQISKTIRLPQNFHLIIQQMMALMYSVLWTPQDAVVSTFPDNQHIKVTTDERNLSHITHWWSTLWCCKETVWCQGSFWQGVWLRRRTLWPADPFCVVHFLATIPPQPLGLATGLLHPLDEFTMPLPSHTHALQADDFTHDFLSSGPSFIEVVSPNGYHPSTVIKVLFDQDRIRCLSSMANGTLVHKLPQ